LKLLSLFTALLFISGCTSIGVIDNQPLSKAEPGKSYSLSEGAARRGTGDISLILAFSGGGTRAAALAYGVMEEMRDTLVTIDGEPRRLLDEIDIISSVSGGSFTSAYYGLYGDQLFDEFKGVFLTQDVQGVLIRAVLSPSQWFSDTGRTEIAVQYYEDHVFHDSTFNDLKNQDGPLILINATDLGYGVRFTFVQQYFNLLCSDLGTFPISRAVTASSAVPMLFNPVVLENYRECKGSEPEWLAAAEKTAADDQQLLEVVRGLNSYSKESRRYAHFVDGGITDNLGLRAIYEIVEVAGGPNAFMKQVGGRPPRHLAIISVNASTDASPKMDESKNSPSLEETVNAVTDAQLHRYNAATLELMSYTIERWARELSTPKKKVTPYFIRLGFRDFEEPKKRKLFNRIPTSFTLSDEQVDHLIAAGRQLLRDNPDFQRFVADLGGVQTE
jgi:NTE family protein